MPGRPRKSYIELEASGAFKKNPKRREKRDKEPSPESGIGGAPSDIGKEVKNPFPSSTELIHAEAGLTPHPVCYTLWPTKT